MFHRLPAAGHRDLFDRLLVWQAIRLQLILISKDAALDAYGKVGLWDCNVSGSGWAHLRFLQFVGPVFRRAKPRGSATFNIIHPSAASRDGH